MLALAQAEIAKVEQLYPGLQRLDLSAGSSAPGGVGAFTPTSLTDTAQVLVLAERFEVAEGVASELVKAAQILAEREGVCPFSVAVHTSARKTERVALEFRLLDLKVVKPPKFKLNRRADFRFDRLGGGPTFSPLISPLALSPEFPMDFSPRIVSRQNNPLPSRAATSLAALPWSAPSTPTPFPAPEPFLHSAPPPSHSRMNPFFTAAPPPPYPTFPSVPTALKSMQRLSPLLVCDLSKRLFQSLHVCCVCLCVHACVCVCVCVCRFHSQTAALPSSLCPS